MQGKVAHLKLFDQKTVAVHSAKHVKGKRNLWPLLLLAPNGCLPAAKGLI